MVSCERCIHLHVCKFREFLIDRDVDLFDVTLAQICKYYATISPLDNVLDGDDDDNYELETAFRDAMWPNDEDYQ